MNKKIVLFFIGIIYLCGYHLAFAGLNINEILYSPTSKQWIEIYNDSDASIDLTKYKILDSGAAVNGHGISAAVAGSNLIESHGYAVVAKVPADFSGSSFPVFKSALGIKASGDTVILRDPAGNSSDDIVQVLADSASDGNSLQLADGRWQASLPTPGAENHIVSADTGATNDDTTDISDDSTPEAAVADTATVTSTSSSNASTTTTASSSSSGGNSSSKSSKKVIETPAPKINVKITVPKMIFTGVPFEFQGGAFSVTGKPLKRGRYFWNFGDGNSKETTEAENFPYTYIYEGDYVASLEYYEKDSSKVPVATAKITLKIVPMSVVISKVGDQEDFFIELSNNTNFQMDISGWILASANRAFVLPRNSNILAKKKIILSSKVTNFSPEDKDTLKLTTPFQEVVFDYGASVRPAVPTKTLAENVAPAQIFTAVAGKNENTVRNVLAEIPVENLSEASSAAAQIPVENLLASAIPASDPYIPTFFPLISFVLIAASAGAVYFIRQNKTVSGMGEEYNILDE